jgi:hypothetical protein
MTGAIYLRRQKSGKSLPVDAGSFYLLRPTDLGGTISIFQENISPQIDLSRIRKAKHRSHRGRATGLHLLS